MTLAEFITTNSYLELGVRVGSARCVLEINNCGLPVFNGDEELPIYLVSQHPQVEAPDFRQASEAMAALLKERGSIWVRPPDKWGQVSESEADGERIEVPMDIVGGELNLA